jgi:hypothetical protein
MKNIISKLFPIELDFKDIRVARQENNNRVVYNSIKNNDMKMFKKNINIKEFERTIRYLELTKEEFFKKCIEDDLFCKLSARNISINASRQGSKDASEQLRTCNFTTKKCGIYITNLISTELRPTKDGMIISKNEMKIKKIQKDCCLKSFDGKISGKINGLISAKIAYGNGGHQDNVFEEMDIVADWWKKYKQNSDDILVILIDTDLSDKFTRIKEKYNNIQNIMIYNHIDFQKYIIDTYYSIESI